MVEHTVQLQEMVDKVDVVAVPLLLVLQVQVVNHLPTLLGLVLKKLLVTLLVDLLIILTIEVVAVVE